MFSYDNCKNMAPAEKKKCFHYLSTSVNTDPNLKTEEGLHGQSGQKFGVVSAILDGRQLQNLEQYRATSDVFNMTVAEDNAFHSPSGTFPAMADGFFVFLEPLPPG